MDQIVEAGGECFRGCDEGEQGQVRREYEESKEGPGALQQGPVDEDLDDEEQERFGPKDMVWSEEGIAGIGRRAHCLQCKF